MAEILGTTIHVTKDHIMDGDRKACTSCPVTLAVKAAFPGVQEVRVDLDTIQIDNRYYATPEKVHNFINRFDYCFSRRSLRSIKFRLTKEYRGRSYEVIKDISKGAPNE